MNSIYAVLTGDLVKSSRLSVRELEGIHGIMGQAVKDLKNAAWSEASTVLGAPEFFRGDSWQLALRDPRWALRAAVYLRSCLLARGVGDTRISIGVGPVRRVFESGLSRSMGEAFELSGRALDDMGPRFRLSLSVSEQCGLPGRWLAVAAHLCDSVMLQWQGRQIETARLLTLNKDASHEQIGRMLSPGVSQQAVSKSLRSAGWHGVAEAMETFEASWTA